MVITLAQHSTITPTTQPLSPKPAGAACISCKRRTFILALASFLSCCSLRRARLASIAVSCRSRTTSAGSLRTLHQTTATTTHRHRRKQVANRHSHAQTKI